MLAGLLHSLNYVNIGISPLLNEITSSQDITCFTPVKQKCIQTNRHSPRGDLTRGRPKQKDWNQTKTKIRNQKCLHQSHLI